MKIVTAWLQQNDWTGHTLALCLLFCLFFLYHFSSFHFQALNSRSSYSVTGVFFGSWHDWLTNIAWPVTQKHDRMCAWVSGTLKWKPSVVDEKSFKAYEAWNLSQLYLAVFEGPWMLKTGEWTLNYETRLLNSWMGYNNGNGFQPSGFIFIPRVPVYEERKGMFCVDNCKCSFTCGYLRLCAWRKS